MVSASSERPASNLSTVNNRECDTPINASGDGGGGGLHDVTKQVGCIVEEFPCDHNNCSGYLYAGPEAVCFRGHMVFLEWLVVLKWEDVVRVISNEKQGIVQLIVMNNSAEKARQLQNSSQKRQRSRTSSSTSVTYDFKLHVHGSVDRVWKRLVSLHSDSILGNDNASESSNHDHDMIPLIRSPKLRRNNSDPMRSRSMARDPSYAESEATTEDEETNDNNSLATFSSFDPPQIPELCDTSDELKQEWDFACTQSMDLKEIVVEDRCLAGCSLQMFYSLFLRDGAEYSLGRFMESFGDSQLVTSPWDLSGKTRSIEYSHPVNAPMAPPRAQACKQQTCRMFGQHGLIVDTKTIVKDLPMTDCFYVTDRISVSGDEDAVKLSMRFDIRFVKGTMFKGLIQRTTKQEVNVFATNLVEYITKSASQGARRKQKNYGLDDEIDEEKDIVTVNEPEPVTATAILSQTPAVGLAPLLLHLALAVIFVLQIFILFEIRLMKSTIRNSGGGGVECSAGVLSFECRSGEEYNHPLTDHSA